MRRLLRRENVRGKYGTIACDIRQRGQRRVEGRSRDAVRVRQDRSGQSLAAFRVEWYRFARALLAVQAFDVVVQSMILRYENSVSATRVALDLVLFQLVVFFRHGTEQSLLVDERQQCDALPDHLLAVHIDIELFRVKVLDGRVIFGHQRLERLGQMESTVSLRQS